MNRGDQKEGSLGLELSEEKFQRKDYSAAADDRLHKREGLINPKEDMNQYLDLRLDYVTPPRKSRNITKEENSEFSVDQNLLPDHKLTVATTAYHTSTKNWESNLQKTEVKRKDLSPYSHSSALIIGSGSKLDHFMLHTPATTKEMLFPDKLISKNLLGSIDDLNKFKNPTPYSTRYPMSFGSPNQVKGFEVIFDQDNQSTTAKKSKVRVKVSKKSGVQGSAESSINHDGQIAKSQHTVSNESSNQLSKRNSDLSLYQLNENYQCVGTKNDPLSTFMFPSKIQEEKTEPMVSLADPPKLVEEKIESSLLGPWCRKTLNFEQRKESGSQQQAGPQNRSYYKGNDYLDPYIIKQARNFHGNPRSQWYVPDTEIYHPAQAILWPGPLIKNEAIFQENITSEK